MNNKKFNISITANEIVAVGSTIKLTLAEPVDPRSAQGAVRVSCGGKPLDLLVELANGARVMLLRLDDTAIGGCQLVVSELLSTKGERLIDHYCLPFAVMPISGKIPEELRVEHVVRLSIGELNVKRLAPAQEPPAAYFDVVKAVHRTSGLPVELAFNERGERVDVTEKLAQMNRRRFEKYGRIHKALFERMEQAKSDDQISIVVWQRLELPSAPYEKPTDGRTLKCPEDEQKLLEVISRATARLRAVLERSNIKLATADRSYESMPFVRAMATAEQIRSLSKDRAVGAIFFDDPSAISSLGNSIAVARSDAAHLAGFDGTGVRVAVWEQGPSDTTYLAFAARFTNTPLPSDHARLTSAIIKNTEPNRPHGHAPDCDLYSANTYGADALFWAVNIQQQCTVVNQSFYRITDAEGPELSWDDLLKDWLALRYPYPTILMAAGNFGGPPTIKPPQDEFVNGKGYNFLAIGNHDDTAGGMAGDSVFRNPTTAHGDRELPELAANGIGVSSLGLTDSGTSFAAPAVAGVVALLQEAHAGLKWWPQACRAILMAAATRNVQGRTWWEDVVNRVDGHDGAGALDANIAVAIALQRHEPNAPGTRRGWSSGTLSSDVVGADRLATFRYRVSTESVQYPTVKVALAWDSSVTASDTRPTASTLTVDLDLIVRDNSGQQVAVAASWDNSYEVVEFAARQGETYDIRIRRWSGTESVWYGIAWAVTSTGVFAQVGSHLENVGGNL